jgi:hypothetical protein
MPATDPLTKLNPTPLRTANFDFQILTFDFETRKPAMDIAGLCLPLKPQKERGYIWVFNNLCDGSSQDHWGRTLYNIIQRENLIRIALSGYGKWERFRYFVQIGQMFQWNQIDV